MLTTSGNKMKTEKKKNIVLILLVIGVIGFLAVQYVEKNKKIEDYPYVETDLGQIRPGIYNK